MGYSYGQNAQGRYVLACDACSNIGGVRKRTCPYKVLTDSLGGRRYKLPYCYPAALCAECYAKHKPTLHANCKDGAARSQADYDATEARIERGELCIVAAWGDWHDRVPEGWVGVVAVTANRANETYRLVPAAEYKQGDHGLWLSDYKDTRPWENPDVPTTKEVVLA